MCRRTSRCFVISATIFAAVSFTIIFIVLAALFNPFFGLFVAGGTLVVIILLIIICMVIYKCCCSSSMPSASQSSPYPIPLTIPGDPFLDPDSGLMIKQGTFLHQLIMTTLSRKILSFQPFSCKEPFVPLLQLEPLDATFFDKLAHARKIT